jgi:formylglycine-generating enzyme required for sulfatase activity
MPGLVVIPQVGEGHCDMNPGWQFLPSQLVLELCPSSCGQITSAGAKIQFNYGCPSIMQPDGGPGPVDAGGNVDGPFPGDGSPPPPPDASTDAGPAIAPMVPILGNMYQMGCVPTDLECDQDESPYRTITLSDYSIDETEVTQGAYDLCIRASVCVAPPCSSWDPTMKADYPVTCVNWSEAMNYCNWLGRRLPTEAEWEVAANGTDSRIYPWGLQTPDCTRANFSSCGADGGAPVRSFPAGKSAFNAFEMAGNVAEWVADWYGPYEDPPPGPNPTGPATGTERIVRGGDFQTSDVGLRASDRQPMEPLTRNDNIGFRCARPGVGGGALAR